MSDRIRRLLLREKERLLAAAVLLAVSFFAVTAFGGVGKRYSSIFGTASDAEKGKTDLRAEADSAESDTAVSENSAQSPASAALPGTWIETEAGWRYQDAAGKEVRGAWVYEKGKYYYLNAAGIMEYAQFRKIGDYRYHLGADGALDIGRFYVGDIEYYADANGVPYTETWVPGEAENQWCYCDALGRILKNQMTPDSYYVGPDGYMVAAPGSRYEGFTYSNGGDHRLYLNLGTADIIWNYFKKKNWNEKAIAGLLGNFQQESGIDPSLEERGNRIGYGLGQWSFERRRQLERYAKARGTSPADIYTQLDFLCQEAGEKQFVSRYARTDWSSPATAAIEWGVRWERYNLSDLSMSRVRIPYAEAYYAHYVDGVTFLVSSTHYQEPQTLISVASAADAEVAADSELLSAEESTDAYTAGESGAENAHIAEGQKSEKSERTEGKVTVRKVTRVTVFETEASQGPGITAAQTAEESTETGTDAKAEESAQVEDGAAKDISN